MTPASTNILKDLNNLRRAIPWLIGAVTYLIAGLTVSIFTTIRACQSHFIDYCLLDSVIATNHHFIFFFVIAIPCLVVIHCSINNEFFYQTALRRASRRSIWKSNVFSLFIISLTWTVLSLIIAVAITLPFVVSVNNWDAETSYFFYSTGTVLTTSFVVVLLATLLGSWAALFALGLAALTVYWWSGNVVLSALFALILSGIYQVFRFPPVLASYNNMLSPFEYALSFAFVAIASGMASILLSRSNIVANREFYE